MRIVLKIGGSLFAHEYGLDKKYMKKLISVIKSIEKRHKCIIVVGGGGFVRSYMKTLEEFDIKDIEREQLASGLLHVVKNTIAFLTGKKPIDKLNKLNKENCNGVFLEFVPGRSTDASAALAAAKTKADILIKLTNVNGIYDKDPNKHRSVKLIRYISFSQLTEYKKNKNKPGSYGILDKTAIGIIEKNKINTVICNGKNPTIILKILRGKQIGTAIA